MEKFFVHWLRFLPSQGIMEIWLIAFENMAEGKLEIMHKNKIYWKRESGTSDERENINLNSLG